MLVTGIYMMSGLLRQVIKLDLMTLMPMPARAGLALPGVPHTFLVFCLPSVAPHADRMNGGKHGCLGESESYSFVGMSGRRNNLKLPAQASEPATASRGLLGC